jgi:hypothetical protein
LKLAGIAQRHLAIFARRDAVQDAERDACRRRHTRLDRAPPARLDCVCVRVCGARLERRVSFRWEGVHASDAGRGGKLKVGEDERGGDAGGAPIMKWYSWRAAAREAGDEDAGEDNGGDEGGSREESA